MMPGALVRFFVGLLLLVSASAFASSKVKLDMTLTLNGKSTKPTVIVLYGRPGQSRKKMQRVTELKLLLRRLKRRFLKRLEELLNSTLLFQKSKRTKRRPLEILRSQHYWDNLRLFLKRSPADVVCGWWFFRKTLIDGKSQTCFGDAIRKSYKMKW